MFASEKFPAALDFTPLMYNYHTFNIWEGILLALLLILVVVIVVGFICVGSSKRQTIDDMVDHTELMAKTNTDATFRVFYRDGTKNIVNVGLGAPEYKAYFSKLV